MVLEDVFLLAVQNLILDVAQVILLHIHFEGLANVWILLLVDQEDPVGSPNAIPGTLRIGLIAEDSSFVESAVKCTDNGALVVPNDILLLLIDLIADIALSLLDEDNLVNLI